MRLGQVINVWIAGAWIAGAPMAVTGPSSARGQELVEPETVYAPPQPPRPEQGVNEGGVSIDLTVNYFTDYVFRGIERFDVAEDRPNIQPGVKLSFDLGKLPHPFIGVFANIQDSDPISDFEEIRPYMGFEWSLRPFLIGAGYNSYIFPDRALLDTSEVWTRFTLDDAYLLRMEKPLISPYVFAAYDVDVYQGWYFEAGVEHVFSLDEIGLSLTAQASVAYVLGQSLYSTTPGGEDSGFQHYQLGLIGSYSLNRLIRANNRYGEWTLRGYLYYTDGLSDAMRSTTQLWGGAGIGFHY